MMKSNLVLILCKSYKTACKAFKMFVEFMEDNEPMEIRKRFEHENCIETYDDLRYIFIDSRFAPVFQNMKPDIVTIQEFFEGINMYYYCDHILDCSDL